MTSCKNLAVWSSRHRLSTALGATFLASIGLVWSLAAQFDGIEVNRSHFTYRPMANAINAAAVPGASATATHPLDEALAFIQPSLKALATVKDYTAVFTKTELIHDRLLTQTMDVKCRQDPFSVYLHGHSERKQGREVIFVAGCNDGKLIVHEVGLKAIAGTMELTPDDPKVMATNRHLITELGIAKIAGSAIAIWNEEKQSVDSANIEVHRVDSVQAAGVECEAIEIIHRHEQPGLIYQIGRVYIDKQTKLPVQGELYGWPRAPGEDPPLLEQYTYTDIKTNVGLGDADFDPQNRDYRFAVSSRD